MKKTIYATRNSHVSENPVKATLLAIFNFGGEFASLLLEPFIRKNFGERYFKYSNACIIAFILAVWPFIVTHFTNLPGARYTRFMADPKNADIADVGILPQYLCWYIFLGFYLWHGYKHHINNKRKPSVFDFKRYSLYRGDTNPAFFKVEIPGFKTDIRFVECYLEPAFFLILGVLLYLIGQRLGGLLIICSLMYAARYISDYIAGDNFIMDLIDQIICNEELEKVFVDDAEPEDSRGFQWRGKKPEDHDVRRKVVPLMREDEEIAEAK